MKIVWFLALWYCTDDLKCQSYDQLMKQPRQVFEDGTACLDKTLEIENKGTKVMVNGREYWLLATCVDKRK